MEPQVGRCRGRRLGRGSMASRWRWLGCMQRYEAVVGPLAVAPPGRPPLLTAAPVAAVEPFELELAVGRAAGHLGWEEDVLVDGARVALGANFARPQREHGHADAHLRGARWPVEQRRVPRRHPRRRVAVLPRDEEAPAARAGPGWARAGEPQANRQAPCDSSAVARGRAPKRLTSAPACPRRRRGSSSRR